MTSSCDCTLATGYLIDTHCHLDFPQFDEDREAVIIRAKEAGVRKVITIGCHVQAAPKAIAIAEKHEGIFAAVGIHPDDAHENFDSDFKIIQKHSLHNIVVAIGETGLDFYREENPTKTQQFHAFEQHIALAKKLHKPVIVHLRSADKEAEEFFSSHHDFPFVIHCFSSDWNFAKKILDWGGMVSFTGIVTFKNADPKLLEVVKKAPLDRIMVETDAPFLAPVPNRGKRNEPAFTADTAKRIAELREISFEELAQKTTENAERFFSV
jgi:TatD DNase family protein